MKLIFVHKCLYIYSVHIKYSFKVYLLFYFIYNTFKHFLAFAFVKKFCLCNFYTCMYVFISIFVTIKLLT